jgi:lipoprotein-anchoring transpeptidase ErfK/SrfK
MSTHDAPELNRLPVELPKGLSRREFLRLSGMGLLGMAVPLRWSAPQLETPDGQLGRVLQEKAGVFLQPSFSARQVKTLWRDEVQPILSATVGDAPSETNRVWYELAHLGYIHSSAVQPVRAEPQRASRRVPYLGTLAEVTLPFVEAYWEASKIAKHAYRFYYSSTHWVNGVTWDKKNRPWYRLYDDRIAEHYFVMAEGLRIVPLAELTPISPEVPPEEKRIEVSLATQTVDCYEGGTQVFEARISSGAVFEAGDYSTPPGAFTTFRKRGSRHMAAGNLASGYDLPGVPWVSYITQEGISFHGTYWHNDFGLPRSHGCINLTPAAAKWLYRWTHPIVPGNLDELWTQAGTGVRIA